MKRGRPSKGKELVDRLEGSAVAWKRAGVILGMVGGELTVEESCGQLGIGRTRLYQLRDLFLSDGIKGLEPKFGGRPPKVESEEEIKIQELEEQVTQLTRELKAAEIRTRIAQVMPHLLKDDEDPKPKAKVKKRRRVKKKR